MPNYEEVCRPTLCAEMKLVFDAVCCSVYRGFQFISRLKHLERLDLGETSLTDYGLLEICNGTRNLKALNVSDTEVSDNGTSGLANLKELRILRLDTKGITNRALANVSLLLRLEKLDLFGAKYVPTIRGDRGVICLNANDTNG